MLMRQDIRLGISIFGDLTAFKKIDDIFRIGAAYYKGLGILIAILISVFIGQEYQWKTWQNKWITNKSRSYMYLSKVIILSAVSVVIFLLFETVALVFSGQIREILTGGYAAMIICGSMIYAALGAVICMLSMLIKSSTASTIVCLVYVLFSETMASLVKGISEFSDVSARFGGWIIQHSIYGMSLTIQGVVSTDLIIPILLNSAIIILLSTVTGLFFFRKYEL